MIGSPGNGGGVRRPIVVNRGMHGGAGRVFVASPQRQPRWGARAEAPPRWRPSSPSASFDCYSSLSATAPSFTPASSAVPHSPLNSSYSLRASAASFLPSSTASATCYYTTLTSPVIYSSSATSPVYYSSPTTSGVSYPSPYLSLDLLTSSPSASPPLSSSVSPPWSSARTYAWSSPSSAPTAMSPSASGSGVREYPQHQQGLVGLGWVDRQLRPSWMAPAPQPPRQSSPPPQPQESHLPSFGARTAAAEAAASAPGGSRHSSHSSGSSGSWGLVGNQSPNDHQPTVESLVPEIQYYSIGLPEEKIISQHPSMKRIGYQVHHSRTEQLSGNHHNSKRTRKAGPTYCAFCKGNNELPRQYLSHALHQKMPDGSFIVTCEVLRSLKCECCGATGDNAHTRSHCPYSQEPSVALLLKNTPRRCDGTLRHQRANFKY